MKPSLFNILKDEAKPSPFNVLNNEAEYIFPNKHHMAYVYSYYMTKMVLCS